MSRWCELSWSNNWLIGRNVMSGPVNTRAMMKINFTSSLEQRQKSRFGELQMTRTKRRPSSWRLLSAEKKNPLSLYLSNCFFICKKQTTLFLPLIYLSNRQQFSRHLTPHHTCFSACLKATNEFTRTKNPLNQPLQIQTWRSPALVMFFLGSLAGSLVYRVPTILPKNRMFSDPSLHYLVQYPRTKTRAIAKLKRRPGKVPLGYILFRSWMSDVHQRSNDWKPCFSFQSSRQKDVGRFLLNAFSFVHQRAGGLIQLFFSLLMSILIRHKDSVIWVDFSVLVTNFSQFSGGAHLVTG